MTKKNLTDLHRSIGIEQFFFSCPIRQNDLDLLGAAQVRNENGSQQEVRWEGQGGGGAGGHICIDKHPQMRNTF